MERTPACNSHVARRRLRRPPISSKTKVSKSRFHRATLGHLNRRAPHADLRCEPPHWQLNGERSAGSGHLCCSSSIPSRTHPDPTTKTDLDCTRDDLFEATGANAARSRIATRWPTVQGATRQRWRMTQPKDTCATRHCHPPRPTQPQSPRASPAARERGDFHGLGPATIRDRRDVPAVAHTAARKESPSGVPRARARRPSPGARRGAGNKRAGARTAL